MAESKEILVFYLDKQRFALQLPIVDRIIRAVEITPLPDAPEIILGLINIQGEIVAVVDTRKRFKYSSRDANLDNFLIVGKMSNRKVALLVDEIGEIVPVAKTKIVESGAILPSMPFIDGAVKLEDDIVFIHDLEKCLSLQEGEELDKALESMTVKKPKGKSKK